MSKNSQNKTYYEIGVLSSDKKDVIAEYVTALPIISNSRTIYEKLMDYLKSIHGNNIIVVWNEREGVVPRDKDEIRIKLPKPVDLKYNK